MTRPSAETNEPEPPLLKRTDDFWTCSSHASVTSKPYFSLSCLRGGWLNSHMPSSALEICMVLERSSPPSAAALRGVDVDFIASASLMPTECGRAPQNSNWKLNLAEPRAQFLAGRSGGRCVVPNVSLQRRQSRWKLRGVLGHRRKLHRPSSCPLPIGWGEGGRRPGE